MPRRIYNPKKIPSDIKDIIQNTITDINELGIQIDSNGWRYSKSVGYSEYDPFDAEDEYLQSIFWVSCCFLKKNFKTPSQKKTVDSNVLRKAVCVWWESLYPEDDPCYVENGSMLLALVWCGYAPEQGSEGDPRHKYWYSDAVHQKGRISVRQWNKFARQYGMIGEMIQ